MDIDGAIERLTAGLIVQADMRPGDEDCAFRQDVETLLAAVKQLTGEREKIASREDVKNVYAEGVDVGLELFRARVKQLEEQRDALTRQVATLTDNRDAWTLLTTQAQERVAALEREVAQLQESNHRRAKSYNELAEEKDELEQQVATLTTHLGTLDAWVREAVPASRISSDPTGIMTTRIAIGHLTRQVATLTKELEDMKRASAMVDDADGPADYQVRLVALALIAREFLRKAALAAVSGETR